MRKDYSHAKSTKTSNFRRLCDALPLSFWVESLMSHQEVARSASSVAVG